MKKHCSLLLLANFLFLSLAYSQKAYTIKFNPPHDSKYSASIASKTMMMQNVGDQNVKMNMDFDLDATYRITEEGANRKLALTYNKVDMIMNVMDQQVKMSSADKDTSHEANAAFRALIGSTVSILMDEYGKIIRVEGTDEILNKITQIQQQKDAMKGVVGEDALKNILEQSFGFYPKAQVKPGDSWNASTMMKLPYPIYGSATYTLSKVEGKMAYITVSGNLRTDSTSSITQNGIEMNFSINGDFTGTTEVDLSTGIPVSASVQQKIKGYLEAGEKKIPMAIHSDMKMTVVQKP